MKTTIKRNIEAPKDITYPCLRISERGRVVLFIAPSTGTLIALSSDGMSDGNRSVGEYSSSWLMSSFTPLNGTVELSND